MIHIIRSGSQYIILENICNIEADKDASKQDYVKISMCSGKDIFLREYDATFFLGSIDELGNRKDQK